MISIVMAAKNYAKFLPMAVRSVQAQTHEDWELVIIDDGSTDGTRDAVRPFLSDPRIRYHQSDMLGQSRAKNLGVRLSRGEVIAFLDADDAWYPEKLERQLAALTDDVGVVACQREIIDETVMVSPKPTRSYGRACGDTQSVTRDAIFIANPLCFSSVMVRRHVFDRVGAFDTNLDLAIDYDLWLRVAKHFTILTLDEKLVLYRTGHGNLSKKQADRIATAFTIMNRHRDGVSSAALAEAYGSTSQSMAWMLRAGEPWRAIAWYLKSLLWPRSRRMGLKGIVGTLRDAALGSTRTASPENQTMNC